MLQGTWSHKLTTGRLDWFHKSGFAAPVFTDHVLIGAGIASIADWIAGATALTTGWTARGDRINDRLDAKGDLHQCQARKPIGQAWG
jgi:hypothetical protein